VSLSAAQELRELVGGGPHAGALTDVDVIVIVDVIVDGPVIVDVLVNVNGPVDVIG
jgi:hypothetical protein